MSIEKGPSAVSEPRIRISLKYFVFVIGELVIKVAFLNFCKGKSINLATKT